MHDDTPDQHDPSATEARIGSETSVFDAVDVTTGQVAPTGPAAPRPTAHVPVAEDTPSKAWMFAAAAAGVLGFLGAALATTGGADDGPTVGDAESPAEVLDGTEVADLEEPLISAGDETTEPAVQGDDGVAGDTSAPGVPAASADDTPPDDTPPGDSPAGDTDETAAGETGPVDGVDTEDDGGTGEPAGDADSEPTPEDEPTPEPEAEPTPEDEDPDPEDPGPFPGWVLPGDLLPLPTIPPRWTPPTDLVPTTTIPVPPYLIPDLVLPTIPPTIPPGPDPMPPLLPDDVFGGIDLDGFELGT